MTGHQFDYLCYEATKRVQTNHEIQNQMKIELFNKIKPAEILRQNQITRFNPMEILDKTKQHLFGRKKRNFNKEELLNPHEQPTMLLSRAQVCSPLSVRSSMNKNKVLSPLTSPKVGDLKLKNGIPSLNMKRVKRQVKSVLTKSSDPPENVMFTLQLRESQ